MASAPITPVTSSSHGQELLQMVRCIVPPLSYDKHKGESGRIAVLGGCKEYTGAPYFAAMAAYRTGCDLSHVFCTSDAAQVIKTYSPDLIVHPELDAKNPVDAISKWLPRMHAVVIGPGLGREDSTLDTVKTLIGHIKAEGKPMVIDADGLYLLSQSPEIIQNYKEAILTPNIVEFKHLYRKVIGQDPPSDRCIDNVTELSHALGNVTVCLKGQEDIISNGKQVIVCSATGSPRRCGGQGDILSGAMGVFICWARQALQTMDGNNRILETFGAESCGAYAACLLTKTSAEIAFKKHLRSMSTTDVLRELPGAFAEHFDQLEAKM